MTGQRVCISINQLRPGAVLPAEIYDGHAPQMLLLREGVVLTHENLARLRERGITLISMDSAYSSAVCRGTPGRLSVSRLSDRTRASLELLRNPLCERLSRSSTHRFEPKLKTAFRETSRQHSCHLQAFFSAMSSSSRPDGQLVRGISFHSVDQLLIDIDLFVGTTLHTLMPQTHAEQCLRAARLGMSMATIAGCAERDVIELGIGCLVSRLGMSDAAQALCSESRQLTSLEMMEIQKTPLRTGDLIDQMPDVPVGSRQVAYQIFERWNGSGYPRGRCGTQIHQLARLAAVADVYIALISPRPYRETLAPYEALELMLQETQRGLFEPVAIRALMQTVGLYPIGVYVELNTGEIAEVVRNCPGQFDRPIVCIVGDERGKTTPRGLNLVERQECRVLRIVPKQEVQQRRLILPDDVTSDPSRKSGSASRREVGKAAAPRTSSPPPTDANATQTELNPRPELATAGTK